MQVVSHHRTQKMASVMQGLVSPAPCEILMIRWAVLQTVITVCGCGDSETAQGDRSRPNRDESRAHTREGRRLSDMRRHTRSTHRVQYECCV